MTTNVSSISLTAQFDTVLNLAYTTSVTLNLSPKAPKVELIYCIGNQENITKQSMFVDAIDTHQRWKLFIEPTSYTLTHFFTKHHIDCYIILTPSIFTFGLFPSGTDNNAFAIDYENENIPDRIENVIQHSGHIALTATIYVVLIIMIASSIPFFLYIHNKRVLQ